MCIRDSSWGGTIFLSISFFLDLFHPTHVMPQYFWYRDTSVRLLVVFEDGHERAADGQSRPIEGMNKLCFLSFLSRCVLIPNAGPSSLEPFKVAAGGDLSVLVLGREPHFDVVGFCRGESQIAGAEG